MMRMSWNPAIEFGCPDELGIDAIETLIVPRTRDFGDFEVTRALLAPKRQMVGPFIFFDQAGPAELLTGQGLTFDRIRISVWVRSPTCFVVTSIIGTAPVPTRSSVPAS
jgi:hypothetical protein